MEFFINNWYILLAYFAITVIVSVAINRFFKLPTEEQLNNVREWLIWAVAVAEKELGGGTGRLKLRAVYNSFVSHFPWLARLVTFSQFSDMVDEALVEFRDLLDKNEAVQEFVFTPEVNRYV